MTKRNEQIHTKGTKWRDSNLTNHDPRVCELVRLIARNAAKRHYSAEIEAAQTVDKNKKEPPL